MFQTFGMRDFSRRLLIQYVLVDVDTFYNIPIGRELLNALGATISTLHLVMKFPNLNGDIITIRADQMEAQECYAKSLLVKSYILTPERHTKFVTPSTPTHI